MATAFAILPLILSTVGGLVWGFILLSHKKKRRTTVVLLSPSEPPELTYGHPWPPVTSLRWRLPKSPQDWTWEISVATDDKGHDIMTVNLLNLVTGDAHYRQRNLTIDTDSSYSGHEETWAMQYRKYTTLKKSIFYNDLLGPVIDWATPLVNKIAHEGEITTYKMG